MSKIELLGFEVINIILVLPKNQIDTWKRLCEQHNFKLSHSIVSGGQERFHSVLNGLNSIAATSGVVAIHDGVRPFVSHQAIINSFDTAHKKGSAVLAVALKDSIRSIQNSTSKAENRAFFQLVQTPQTFDLALIKDAYKTNFSTTFTDDASVFEANNQQINLVEGNYENIKITTPEDLIIGEALLKAIENEKI